MKIKALKKHSFFITIIFLGLASLIPAFSRYQDSIKRSKSFKEKIEKLKVENSQLKKTQHKLETDPVYAESVARKNLGFAREDEVVYKIIPEE